MSELLRTDHAREKISCREGMNFTKFTMLKDAKNQGGQNMLLDFIRTVIRLAKMSKNRRS